MAQRGAAPVVIAGARGHATILPLAAVVAVGALGSAVSLLLVTPLVVWGPRWLGNRAR